MRSPEFRYWLKRCSLLFIAYVLYLLAWQSAFADDRPIPLGVFEKELENHIHVNPSGANVVGHIFIGGHGEEINQSTWLYVKKALDYYKKSQPIFVILELNTPGGEVFSAQNISDALKELDTQSDIPVVAYINNWAISAGAMLAYSSRFIVVAKDASMGGAEPVFEGSEGGLTTASEKINSVIRTDFANRAAFFGRNPLIAEAMVDKDMILVVRDGQVVKLDNDSQIRTQGPKPDQLLSAKGKLLTLNAEQLLALGVVDLMIPPTKLEPLTEAEAMSGRWPARKSALFQQPFFNTIPDVTIDSFQMDWKMRFFALLGSPFVSSLLVLGLIVGFYLEVTNPGGGVPGAVAAVCLLLITISSFSLEIANWLELILLLTGICIILIELFVLPTFGLLGFVGIALFLVGLVGMIIPGVGAVGFEFNTFSLNAAGEVFLERLGWLCGTLLLATLIIIFLLRYLTPKTIGFNRFVLYGGEQTGYVSAGNIDDYPSKGKTGIAATTLRPAGKVLIDGVHYDAISQGALIEKGDPIEVLGLDSSTLIVTIVTK